VVEYNLPFQINEELLDQRTLYVCLRTAAEETTSQSFSSILQKLNNAFSNLKKGLSLKYATPYR
jgi:hypothetical protein